MCDQRQAEYIGLERFGIEIRHSRFHGRGSVMSETITVYEKPTCTTCRKLVSLLREEGIDFERVNYMIDPLSRSTLERLLAKAELRPRDVLRKREKAYKELDLGDETHSDADILQAIVDHPELLQRPIVERGDRAVLARPVEEVRAIL
ncbi:MAG: arsenate reductase (glutaredoxin) [Gemmatimonadota bacterium]|nr:arsenate reductase (glutaredoxin) [Gemmatimonadota bacterium]